MPATELTESSTERSPETKPTRTPISRTRRIIFSLLVIVVFFGLLEFGARAYDYLQPDHLEAYKQLSNNPILGYELIPNYRARTANGKRDALVINSRGYRGPEFTPEKPVGTKRIICLGDSCTFEGIPENAPYPRRLEEQLNEDSTGQKYEVINAAVEGYDSNKALERLKATLAFHPDIVTIYIGWNDIYNTDPARAAVSSGKLQHLTLLLQHSRFLAKLRSLIFIKLRPKLKQREEIKAAQYRQYQPTNYEANLREMLALVRQEQAQPILLTLPSILSSQISDAALTRAHFPYHTNSVADMLALIEQYNDTVRKVAGETNTPLIDLAKQFDSYPDKEKYFSDAIHMYNDAKPLVAEQIKTVIKEKLIVPAEKE